jgi:hypothetical protein
MGQYASARATRRAHERELRRRARRITSGIRQIHAKSHGVLTTYIVRRAVLSRLIGSGWAPGTPIPAPGETGRAIQSALHWTVNAFSSLAGLGPTCGACQRDFDGNSLPPAAVLVTVPLADGPRKAIVVGICDACGGGASDEALAEMGRQCLSGIWPDLHHIRCGTA